MNFATLSPNQTNPSAARPEDFKIENRDGGQTGDTPKERAALLAEGHCDRKTRQPTPERNEVPQGAVSKWGKR
jgi:hypothetical protein